MYPIATGNQEQSIELPDVAGDDHQETSEAEKVNLVSAASGVEKNEGTDTAEREKPATSGPESGEVGRTAEVQEAAVPEKLQDDDQLKEIWYKRLLFKVFPKLMRGVCVCVCVHVDFNLTDMEFFPVEERRILRANDDVYNWQFRYVVSERVSSVCTPQSVESKLRDTISKYKIIFVCVHPILYVVYYIMYSALYTHSSINLWFLGQQSGDVEV